MRWRPSISSQLPSSFSKTKIEGSGMPSSRLNKFRLLPNVPSKEPLEFRVDDNLPVLVHTNNLSNRHLVGVGADKALGLFNFF